MQLPQEFVQRMQTKLGKSYQRFYLALQEPSKTSIRLNPLKLTGFEITKKKVAWEPYAFYLDNRPVFTLDPLFHAGAYYVQEASSMFTGFIFKQLFEPEIPIKILDLCGAPGGKTTHISSLMNSKSLLVANEVIKTRARILVENVVKWGNPNVLVSQNDPIDFQSLNCFFDAIFVDAPCSGEGLFRRDSDAVNEWSVENAKHCALRQQRIVTDVWDSLAPGGFLIYSTCTFNPGENEENLNWLLKRFDTQAIDIQFPENWGIDKVPINGGFGYQFFPHQTEGEGFFIAVVQKTGNEKIVSQKVKVQQNKFSKQFKSQLEPWFNNAEVVNLQQRGNTCIALPSGLEEWIFYLELKLRIIKFGNSVAEIKGEKLIPHPDFAFSGLLSKTNVPKIELSYYDALIYLKRDLPFIESQIKGYQLITYKNIPLGWINHLGNRSNNLFPSEWRIRMLLPPKNDIQEPQFLGY